LRGFGGVKARNQTVRPPLLCDPGILQLSHSQRLIAPHGVEALMFNPAYQHLSATSALMIGCC
jgi:hypothetical protein